MYRLSWHNHYFRDFNILFKRYGEIPNKIDIQRIKLINNNKRKKYFCIVENKIRVYNTLKELPITREQLWFCFNNEIPDKQGRIWNIKNYNE